MSTDLPRPLLRIAYEETAEAYLRSLPPEHFMEATAQATQREITVESLALVRAQRPDVQYFNELLIQYPLPRQRRPGQVEPDNMVVICPEPIQANGSYDLPFQPVAPFLVMEYVSEHNKRKDYEDSFRKYERQLKVPYYLVFYPDNQELTLFRHGGRKYLTTRPNEQGRYPISPLDLEVALLDGWVRFWYQGELLPLPAELQHALEETRRRLTEVTHRAEALQRRAEASQRRAEEERAARVAAEQEVAQLRSQLEQSRGRPKRSP